MKRIGLVSLWAFIFLLTGGLWGEPQKLTTVKKSAKDQVIIFGTEFVEGAVFKPGADIVMVPRTPKQESLIKVRQSFINEMVKSVTDK